MASFTVRLKAEIDAEFVQRRMKALWVREAAERVS